MIINAQLVRKQSEFLTDICSIEKVVELSEDQYFSFRRCPMQDWDFLREFNAEEHESHMERGIRPCVLILGEGYDDGICVFTAGYDYARYSAFIPNARQIVEAKMEIQNDIFISM